MTFQFLESSRQTSFAIALTENSYGFPIVNHPIRFEYATKICLIVFAEAVASTYHLVAFVYFGILGTVFLSSPGCYLSMLTDREVTRGNGFESLEAQRQQQ